jgi:hypothetical protein
MHAIAIQAESQRNDAVGDTMVHSIPAIALAAKLPRLCAPASNPNAETRTDSAAIVATAAASAVLHEADPEAREDEGHE